MRYVEVLLLWPVLSHVQPRDGEDCAHDELGTGGPADHRHSPDVSGCRIAGESAVGGGREVVEELEVKEANGRVESRGCAVAGNRR